MEKFKTVIALIANIATIISCIVAVMGVCVVAILRAGQFCALQLNSLRSSILITPNKRSAVRGIKASTLSELRSSSTPYGVVEERRAMYPELRSACTGLSILNSLRSLIVIMMQFTKSPRMKYKFVVDQLLVEKHFTDNKEEFEK
jgi:hypothetical protein